MSYGPWERCGNTPFYRYKGNYPDTLFIDPFNWVSVSIYNGSEDPEGATNVFYTKRRRYKRYSKMSEGLALDEWAKDLAKAKASGASLTDLRALFEAAPKEIQEEVLSNIPEMLEGETSATRLFAEIFPKWKFASEYADPEYTHKDTMVVVRSSPAFKQLEKLKEKTRNLIVSDTLEEGLQETLAMFGIHEC